MYCKSAIYKNGQREFNSVKWKPHVSNFQELLGLDVKRTEDKFMYAHADVIHA